MKRLPILALLGALFISVPLLAPSAAVGHPGNTCNPPAGHGRSGCHKVTAAKPTAPAKKAAVKRAARPAPVAAPAAPTYPPITDAELGAAFFGTQAGYGGRGDR